MKRVLVTGAAGFIGSNVCKRLVDEGHLVIGVDNFDDFYDPQLKRDNIKDLLNHSRFRIIEGDIRDEAFVNEVFTLGNLDLVIHLAARAGVRPSIEQPALYYDVNVNGTLVLLEAMKKNNVTNMLFASSSSVYGNNKKTPFAETDNVDNPISPYAASKKAGELLCYTYNHLYDFNIFCLRFFTVYGKNQRPEMAIQKFGKLVKEGNPIVMFGDGSSRRDYTYIDDIVDGIIKSMDNLKGYEILNLGNSDTIALESLILLIGKTLGKEVTIERKPMQPGDVDITYADVSKAKKLIGYHPRHSIELGLEKMFDKHN
jgi:UDP-glucuronate 4-epimerase